VSESPTEPTPELRPEDAATEALAPSPAPERSEADTTPATPAAPGVSAGPGWSRGRVLAVGVLVLVLGAGAGFLLGRSTADSGPTTLAAAVDQTVKGDLPAGDLSLDQLLGAAGQRLGGADGGLGGLLGRDGSGAGGTGVLGQILDQLGQRLGDRFGGGSTTPDSTVAFLGVQTEAAPNGQPGARVVQVAAASPAADAGLRVGDVVTAVDGTAVADPSALAGAVQSHEPGDQITVTFARDGASSDVKVRLGHAGSSTTAPATPPTTRTT
jgi:membrane-associated protease RseP (regulator of RpoE activity)